MIYASSYRIVLPLTCGVVGGARAHQRRVGQVHASAAHPTEIDRDINLHKRSYFGAPRYVIAFRLRRRTVTTDVLYLHEVSGSREPG